VPGKHRGMMDLVVTSQAIYGAIGLLVGILLAVSAGMISNSWIKAEELSRQEIHLAVLIVAATFAVRWLISFYQGILRGLERQVLVNVALVAVAVFRAAGVICVLIWISKTLTAFLIWQMITVVFEVAWLKYLSWKHLPQAVGYRGKFSWASFGGVWQFSSLLWGVGVLGVLIAQLDKMFVSAMLPLEQMGFYSAAVVLSGGIAMIASPVYYAVFPRFCSLIASDQSEALSAIYHRMSKLVACLLMPAAAILVVFPREVLWCWTRSEILSVEASMPLVFLSLGALANALMMSVPMALQLAAGLVWIPFWGYAAGIIFLVPAFYLSVKFWGITGPAVALTIFSMCYLLIVQNVTHARVLKGGQRRWFFEDTLLFSVPPVLISGVGLWALGRFESSVSLYFFLAIAAAFAFLANGLLYQRVKGIGTGKDLPESEKGVRK
ncbi:MAG TPA: oligosaccharide flippase family protein, partial [Candidatus Omnitrophota bacterium]|nr:oligosaccharide flippase family protein [Candidatus Omnitrophota bacterium]